MYSILRLNAIPSSFYFFQKIHFNETRSRLIVTCRKAKARKLNRPRNGKKRKKEKIDPNI